MTTTTSAAGASSALLTAMNPVKAASAESADDVQNRFMKLLITQMKNQDPLNPMDNAQVTSQMAQLSTVTGIDKLNVTLKALQGDYQSSQALAAAGMIGHGVLVSGTSVELADSKGIFGIEMTESADRVRVVIRNTAGEGVHAIDIGAQEAGIMPLAWDGSTTKGDKAPDGKYTIEVEALRGGQKLTTASTLSFGQVVSVATNAQGVKLSVPGIGPVSLPDVRQIL